MCNKSNWNANHVSKKSRITEPNKVYYNIIVLRQERKYGGGSGTRTAAQPPRDKGDMRTWKRMETRMEKCMLT